MGSTYDDRVLDMLFDVSGEMMIPQQTHTTESSGGATRDNTEGKDRDSNGDIKTDNTTSTINSTGTSSSSSTSSLSSSSQPPLSSSQTEEEKQVIQLQKDAIVYAEKNNFTQALGSLAKAIAILPTYPPSYNNRAQVYQLMGELSKCGTDIEKAVALATDQQDTKTLAQAYTQRGMLCALKGETQKAQLDFERAGKLGHKFATDSGKEMARRNNPVAKMCDQAVAQMMERELTLYSDTKKQSK